MDEDKMNITIRMAEISDAWKWAKMLHELDNESPYTMFEPYERSLDCKKYEEKIRTIRNNTASAIFLAIDEQHENKVVGYVSIETYKYRRKSHVATIGIGVIASYRSKGVASQFIPLIREHAQEHALKRVESHIAKDNYKSIKLATEFGFHLEAIKKNAIYINGEYKDEYLMVWDVQSNE